MPTSSLKIVVLAAGESRRMRSNTPKVLHSLGGRPVLAYVLEQALALNPQHLTIVASTALEQSSLFQSLLPPQATYVLQKEARGTGDAVRTALEGDKKTEEALSLLVLFGDTPLLTLETLQALLQKHQEQKAGISLLGIRPPSPQGYGRLVLDSEGFLTRVIEEKDADALTRSNPLCNGGVMVLRADVLPLLSRLSPQNQAGEYYLTDLVALAHQAGKTCTFFEAPFEEALGINTREDLSVAEAILQNRWRKKALADDVSLLDPSSTHLSFDTNLAPDVTLFPHVFLGPGVTLHAGVTVLPFSVLEQTTVKRGARVGPFCHLRHHTVLGENVQIGNFVEVKKSTLEAGVTAKHLSYLGDATIGARANIGAGTITCNYDGKNKHQTIIGEQAFLGSQTALVAPVSIGRNAMTAAGSVITQDVPADTLAIGRARQENLPRKPRAGPRASSD